MKRGSSIQLGGFNHGFHGRHGWDGKIQTPTPKIQGNFNVQNPKPIQAPVGSRVGRLKHQRTGRTTGRYRVVRKSSGMVWGLGMQEEALGGAALRPGQTGLSASRGVRSRSPNTFTPPVFRAFQLCRWAGSLSPCEFCQASSLRARCIWEIILG